MLIIAGQNDIAVNVASYLNDVYKDEWAIVLNHGDNGFSAWQRSVKRFAMMNNLNIITLEEAYQVATVFISLEYDRIIQPKKFSKSCKCFNLHFSLLPKYKGVATSVWPILNGDAKTGVTLHEIDHGIDTGSIIAQKEFSLNNEMTAYDVYLKNMNIGYSLLIENLQSLIEGNYVQNPQMSQNSTYYGKRDIDYSESKINVFQTAQQVARRCRAYTFRPYQLPSLDSKPIARAVITNERSNQIPGTILDENPSYIKIATIDYNLLLYKCMIHRLLEMRNCDITRAKEIIEGLCNINDFNEYGWTPLIVAAYNGNLKIVRMLLDFGADINARNIKGTTVLMYAKDYAISTGDKSVFDFLISRGANTNAKDWNDKSLSDYISEEETKWLGI